MPRPVISRSATVGGGRVGRLARRLIHGLSTTLGVGAALTLCLLLGMSTIDVILRESRGRGLGGVIESGEILLVMLALLSLAAAYRVGAHVNIDLLSGRIPTRLAAVLEAVGTATVVAIIAWMAWVSAGIAWDSYAQGEYRIGVTRVPLWPARSAVALGAAALALEMSLTVVRAMSIATGRIARAAGDQPTVTRAADLA